MENQNDLQGYRKKLQASRINSLLKLKFILGPEAYDQAVKKYKECLDKAPPKNRIPKQTPPTTNVPDYLWVSAGLPIPQREFRFDPVRMWRIDFAFPEKKLAIEIEGGIFTNGRHTRIGGFLGDIEKYNALTKAGWRLLRYPPRKIKFSEVMHVYENTQ